MSVESIIVITSIVLAILSGVQAWFFKNEDLNFCMMALEAMTLLIELFIILVGYMVEDFSLLSLGIVFTALIISVCSLALYEGRTDNY